MLRDAFEVRRAAGSVGFAGERPDDGPAKGRRWTGCSTANPKLLDGLSYFFDKSLVMGEATLAAADIITS